MKLLPPVSTDSILSRGLPAVKPFDDGPPNAHIDGFHHTRSRSFRPPECPFYKCRIIRVPMTLDTDHAPPELGYLILGWVLEAIRCPPRPTTQTGRNLSSVRSVDGNALSQSSVAMELHRSDSETSLLRLERRFQLTQRTTLHPQSPYVTSLSRSWSSTRLASPNHCNH